VTPRRFSSAAALAERATTGDHAIQTGVLQRTCPCGRHTNGGETCDECRTTQSSSLQRCGVETLAVTSAPPIVHRVLGRPGRPLDPAVRAGFEASHQRDFADVRIHDDAAAADSARSVKAAAYTVGRHIAFAHAQFAPGTTKGEKLLGHELTHVIQQERGAVTRPHGSTDLRVVEDPALERDADRQATGSRPPAPSPALQRVGGWSGSPGLNVGESPFGKIRRIPVEGLTQGNQEPDPRGTVESARGRAIVLVHEQFDEKQGADVLLHFHGHNMGYRAEGGRYRDRDLDRIEQQMDASTRKQLIGVLPQGTPGSWFGATGTGKAKEKRFLTDAFLTEILATLTALKVWAAAPKIGNVMLTGHSGAGELIDEKLLGGAPTSSLPSKVGRLAEVVLFDAVNGPNEFLATEKWLEDQLNADLAKASAAPDEPAKRAYLATSMRFRAYFTNNAYYTKWHVGPLPYDKKLAGKVPLRQFVDGWFTANESKLGGAASPVYTALRRNYDVIPAGHKDHERVMATGDRLKEAISILPARSSEAASAAENGAPASVVDALRSPAAPLDPGAAPGLGTDVGPVRIHTGRAAAEATRDIGAAAFTVGRQIVFGAGRYDPDSPGGQALLRHELTHVRQQAGRIWASVPTAPLRIGSPHDGLEAEAERVSRGGEAAIARPAPAPLVQRQPVDPGVPRDVCETTQKAPKFNPGDCSYKEPRNCPTYESWLNTFRLVKTFKARATPAATEPNLPATGERHVFDVLGEPEPKQRAKRYGSTATIAEPPPPTGTRRIGEKFIDHPTDDWVKQCLPPNLRATAYQLPSDCADIAVILRHVWLAAHRRTEEFGGFTIGDKAGQPAAARVGEIIAKVGSADVSAMVNSYTNVKGELIRSFKDLEPMLHPGDILVWGHFKDVPNQLDRTGGHTLTIVEITRQNGKITRLLALQGNEPIFGPADPPAGGAPKPDDDKGKIIAAIGRKDSHALREELGHAPGRRIETRALVPGELGDTQVRVGGKGKPQPVWFWPADTLLVAAGPARAARRPAQQSAGKGRVLKDRQLTDWIPSFQRATADTFPGVFEAAVLEARNFHEAGHPVAVADARKVGAVAGEQFWKLVKAAGAPKNSLNQALLARMPQLLAMLRGIRDGANPAAAVAVKATFNEIETAFTGTAIGATDVKFGTGAAAPAMRMLLSAFGPFHPSGTLAPPPTGTWNPSAAAVLALDGTKVDVGTEAGKPVKAGLEGIVLPVDFETFDRGTVERVVRPLVADTTPVDAVITVSQGIEKKPGTDPLGPIRIERYAVGVRDDPRRGKGLTPVPAAPPDPIGPAIIESTVPVGDVATRAAAPIKGRPDIAMPQIGQEITFRFADKSVANDALKALGLPPQNKRDVEITDPAAIKQIASTTARDPNGVDLTFKAAGKQFKTTLLEGPGGNFLSNEVSYRVLRMLQQSGSTTAIPSFHVHTPLAKPIPEDPKAPKRKEIIDESRSLRARLIITLQRIVAATGSIILGRRKAAKGGTP
jgi:Domain of unknown function (DUF4157)